MKNYEETAKKVLSMRDDILRKKAEKRKKVMTFCPPAAALCLALIIGIGISSGMGEEEPPVIGGIPFVESQREELQTETPIEGGEGDKRTPEKHNADSGKSEHSNSGIPAFPTSTFEVTEAVTSSKTGLVTEPPAGDKQMDICRGLVYINRIMGEATAARRAYDKMNYYSEQITAEEAEEYYRIDIEEILNVLPTEMAYIPSEHTIIKKNNGTTADDSAHFYIEGKDNESITISCGNALPPYDCIYMLSHEKTSEVITESGESVEMLMGYRDNNEESGICGLFFADFKLGDTYYRIVCRNVSTLDGTIGAVISAIIS